MKTMRLRLGALAFCAVLVAVLSGGCKLAGVSAVYMAIDSAGDQERTVFFTDSIAAYCITKFSSAKQDATVDFIIHEVEGPLTTMAQGGNPTPFHPIFATDEETPGPGTETVVSFQIPPNGIQIEVSCMGYCVQNGIACMKDYTMEAFDSCGVGSTCCENLFDQSAMPTSVIPYPVGNFTCEVDVDGELAGLTPFSIEYPPTTTINGTQYQCPIDPPVDGVICAGWVMQGARCPGFDARQTCVCDGASWTCK